MMNPYKKIAEENKERLGTDLSSRKSQIEIYKDPTHFFYEILQNADDYEATEITFDLKPEKLVIVYNGEPFEDEHVRAITYFGESTGADDTTKVGRFGIGFKSVLAFTATPVIQSGQHSFKIRGLYSPEFYLGEYDKKLTTITLPFNLAEEKPEFISEEKWLEAADAFDKIAGMLESMESHTLLFTKHLTRIKRSIDGTEIEPIEKPKNYRLFKRPFKYDGKPHRDIVLAFERDDEGKIITDKARAEENKLFVLFKTEEETKTGFLINAIFETMPSRESVDFGAPFNTRLIEEIGELFISTLKDLQQEKLLTTDIINMLALDSENSIAQYLKERLVKASQEKQIKLPTTGKSYGFSDEVARGENKLAELLSNAQLNDLFGKKYWLASGLKVADKLEIDTITRSDFMSSEKLESFLKKQKIHWLKQFYGWCKDRWYQLDSINSKPIVRTQSGKMVAAYKNNKPQVYMPVGNSTTNTGERRLLTVHGDLLKGRGSKNVCKFFAQHLKISNFDVVAEVREIVKKYGADANIEVSVYKRDFKQVFDLWKKEKGKRAEIIGEVTEVYFVSTQEHGYCQGHEVYFNQPILRRWFIGNSKEGKFLHQSQEYAGYKDFLERVKVNTDPRKLNDDEWKAERPRYPPGKDARYGSGIAEFNPEFNFAGLEHCLKNNIDLELSVYLFALVDKCIEKLHGKYRKRPTLNPTAFETIEGHSEAGKLLTSHAWLYDKESNPKPTKDMKLSDLHGDYKVKESNRAKLEKALGFKPELYTEEQVQAERKQHKEEIEKYAEENSALKKENEELRAAQSSKPKKEPIDTSVVTPVTKEFIPARPTRPRQGRRASANRGVTEPAESANLEPDKEVGRAGEAIANKWLLKEFPNAEFPNAKVVWENENREQVGYDFKVTIPGHADKFYEVKSTSNETASEFVITQRQWEKANEEKDNYCILLVKCVGKTERPPVTPIDNPAQKIEAGEIQIRAYKVLL